MEAPADDALVHAQLAAVPFAALSPERGYLAGMFKRPILLFPIAASEGFVPVIFDGRGSLDWSRRLVPPSLRPNPHLLRQGKVCLQLRQPLFPRRQVIRAANPSATR